MIDHKIYRDRLEGRCVYAIDYLGQDLSQDKRVELRYTGGVMTITDPVDISYITKLRHEAIRLCAREPEFCGEDIVKYIVFHLRYGEFDDE